MVRKLIGWQRLMRDEFEESRKLSFAWGEHDCVLFTAKVIDSMCGSTFYRKVRRDFQWHDAASAARIIRAAGGLTELVSLYLGGSSPRLTCRAGDPMLFNLEGREYLGIHEGHAIVSVGEEGRAVVQLQNAVHGWRLG